MARRHLSAYLRQREGGRVVSVAATIAVAANTDVKREIVDLHVEQSEAETFWSGFLKSIVRRGLNGVKLVISDAHEGLKAAVSKVPTATWQRCRVGPLKKCRGLDSIGTRMIREAWGDAGTQGARSA